MCLPNLYSCESESRKTMCRSPWFFSASVLCRLEFESMRSVAERVSLQYWHYMCGNYAIVLLRC